MAVTFHRRGIRGALTALCLVAGLLVTPASPHHVTAAPGDAVSWVQVGGDIDGERSRFSYYGDEAGHSVATSNDGTTMILGAPRTDDDNDPDGRGGFARVYRFDGNGWVQLGGDIKGRSYAHFGWSVAMSGDGNTVIIGAPKHSGAEWRAGQARVYHFDGGQWVQVGTDIDGRTTNERSGYSVAMTDDGTTVIIGAIVENDSSDRPGLARVYRFEGNDWVQVGRDIDGGAAGDEFGGSVAMSSDGTMVVIGAIGGTDDAPGLSRVFRRDDAAWEQVGDDIVGEAAGDRAGSSVSMGSDGSLLVIGATGNDDSGDDAGHARVFRLDGTAWVQVGDDIDGEAAGDNAGRAVAMSRDGTTVIIGASGNNGINGDRSGHARVFRFDGDAWVQIGDDIDGEDRFDNSGHSVALSGAGSRVIVGAPGANLFRSSGHARVFDLVDRSARPAIAYVAGDLQPPRGDRPIVSHLQASGAIVTVVDDDDATSFDYSGHDLVFLSTSVTLSKIGDHFRDLAIPLVTNEHFLLDDNAMGSKPISQETTDQVRIVESDHELAASFAGDVVISATATPIGYATPGPGAEVIATFRGRAVYFSYRTDSEMVGGRTAPARRVYFPGTFATASAANTNYFELLDTAIGWALDGFGNEQTIACRHLVTDDFVLQDDLTDCPGDGLLIGADGVTVDLNGHTIDGLVSSTGTGVVLAGRDGVTIRNGTIRDFPIGVGLSNSHDNTVEDLDIESSDSAVYLTAADRNTIQRVSAGTWPESIYSAVFVSGVGNTLTELAITNSTSGVVLRSGPNTLSNSVISRTPDAPPVSASKQGVNLGGAANVVVDNVIRGFDVGVWVDPFARDVRIERNTVSENKGTGITLGVADESFVIASNTAITENVTSFNGGSGIIAPSDLVLPTTLTGNTANDNAGWGILASESATDGGGNTATGNSAGQCRGVDCSPPLECGDITGTAGELASAGYHVIVGTDGDDFLPGTDGNDFILGLDGKDVILAGMGDDVVCAGGSHDTVVGGDGFDQLHGEGGNDDVRGGNQNDLITGGTGKDVLDGGNGDDDVSGDGADDTIRGGNDNDVLRGGDGRDDVRGDAGNDTLSGDAADDVLRGNTGTDVCDGGTHVNGDQAFSCETVIDVP